MNKALRVPLRGAIGVDRLGVADAVLLDVFAGGDEGWREGAGEEEGLGVLRVADGDVAVGWREVRRD